MIFQRNWKRTRTVLSLRKDFIDIFNKNRTSQIPSQIGYSSFEIFFAVLWLDHELVRPSQGHGEGHGPHQRARLPPGQRQETRDPRCPGFGLCPHRDSKSGMIRLNFALGQIQTLESSFYFFACICDRLNKQSEA